VKRGFRVVADQAGAIVFVRDIRGDQSMQVDDEFCRQRPARGFCGGLRQVVGCLDIECALLLDRLHLAKIEDQGTGGFFLAQRAALDGVGAEHAADHDLLLQSVRHLRQEGGDEACVRVFNALERQIDSRQRASRLEDEGPEAVGVHPARNV
jgi:hypothetical protein